MSMKWSHQKSIDRNRWSHNDHARNWSHTCYRFAGHTCSKWRHVDIPLRAGARSSAQKHAEAGQMLTHALVNHSRRRYWHGHRSGPLEFGNICSVWCGLPSRLNYEFITTELFQSNLCLVRSASIIVESCGTNHQGLKNKWVSYRYKGPKHIHICRPQIYSHRYWTLWYNLQRPQTSNGSVMLASL